MKTTDINLYIVYPGWLFLKIITDEGNIGLGEPFLESASRILMLKVIAENKNSLLIEYQRPVMHHSGYYRGKVP